MTILRQLQSVRYDGVGVPDPGISFHGSKVMKRTPAFQKEGVDHG